MKLTVLGSGTCIPSLTRNAPGYLLQANGRHLLVDCGSGISRQLARAGFACSALDGIFLTHLHPDHCADLVAIIQALLVGDRENFAGRLLLGGDATVGQYYRSSVGEWLGPLPFAIKLLDMRRPVVFEDIRIDTAPTVHMGNGCSLAYRFIFKDLRIVFTGDAEYSEALSRLAAGADLLVADCSSLARDKRAGHMSAKDCGVLARQAKVKAVLLSHLYPAGYADQERIEECRSEFSGIVLLAEDLKEYDLAHLNSAP